MAESGTWGLAAMLTHQPCSPPSKRHIAPVQTRTALQCGEELSCLHGHAKESQGYFYPTASKPAPLSYCQQLDYWFLLPEAVKSQGPNSGQESGPCN